MSPYVEFQKVLISSLISLVERGYGNILRKLVERLRQHDKVTNGKAYILEDEYRVLSDHGLRLPQRGQHEVADTYLIEILLEQIDDSDPKRIVIRNLLGNALHRPSPVGFEEYMKRSIDNALRTDRICQPGALRKGDVLGNGDVLLSEPREGGNGAILLHLTGGHHGHWISVPARIPLALLTEADNAPADFIDRGKGIVAQPYGEG